MENLKITKISKYKIQISSSKYKPTSFMDVKWIKKDIMMHPPINILINLNNIIKKHVRL
jgi:hypothetical protein